MANWQKFYLFRIEFLGFRYHGWQKQPNLKTVQGMIDKTFTFIFKHENFKTLGSGRTDAKVSADDFVFELFANEELDLNSFQILFNSNLPSDIRLNSIEEVNTEFNILQHSKAKEYHYYFNFGEKNHPFVAPYILNFGANLDVDLMKEAATLFLGQHNFKRYAAKNNKNTDFVREVLSAEIIKNDRVFTNYDPEISYVFKVRAKGFLRYQVRLMMGALVDIGNHELSLEELKQSLKDIDGQQMKRIAPSSGLMLHKVDFE
ncbi:MAG: tRNA pseudouridine(38-40) synthase TruA [Crocinitomicaceae bacterium]|nr:tRNA pseudouridine(38-40) synthase TruA [Crocinitomicaceae bacterium]